MKKKILKDYTPAFSLSHLQSLNDITNKHWSDEITKKQILNNLEQAKEIEKMVIPVGALVEIISEGYESDYNVFGFAMVGFQSTNVQPTTKLK